MLFEKEESSGKNKIAVKHGRAILCDFIIPTSRGTGGARRFQVEPLIL